MKLKMITTEQKRKREEDQAKNHNSDRPHGLVLIDSSFMDDFNFDVHEIVADRISDVLSSCF